MDGQRGLGVVLISVGIVTYNNASTLSRSLHSILENQFAEPYEIILVDNGSSDQSLDVAQHILTHANETGIPFKILKRGINNLSAARNDIIANSQGKFIAFTDPDCEVPSDWLKSLSYYLITSPLEVAGVGGSNRPPLGHWLFPVFSLLGHHKIGHFFSSQISQTGYMQTCDQISTCNAIFRKSALLQVNGFSGIEENFKDNFGEDLDLCYKLRSRGQVLKFSAQISVQHHLPDSFWSWLVKCFRYGSSQFPTLYRQGFGLSPTRLAPAFVLPLLLLSSVYKPLVIPYLLVGHWMILVALSTSAKVALQAALTQWIYLLGYLWGMIKLIKGINITQLKIMQHKIDLRKH